ncbi:DUF1269 domain-containing protein [Noviherbaspirillum denitrificans]|uniref:DUF1269 domain-containing protein n=1 Tax=Noviherbaspirillum denitrificans TaxID=1968433 RepID=A0A254TD65_9BURK|nr:DUF1269 domain-containing protein [Noviherbaspirillum denitrificans]OWW20581.1 hypothetical protein AYR66_14885 [Noviherbaspirillum denitrificans]
MRHRLYYLLPDVESARRTLDDMLLNRIDQGHLHFLAKGALPEDMPEANFLQKTDVVHGAKAGMLAGAALGMALGFLVVYYFSLEAGALAVTASTLVGVLFGGWAASLVAAAIPNSRLAAFFPEIEKGKVLLIADVPARRIEQIERVLAERHPEIKFSGEEPTIPAFP